MPKYFALVDCNNFYVSCERVFNPKLEGRPVVILSNNDGCFVSRSDEIKDLGIPMGAPYFEWKEELRKRRAVVFSSNYALYGDMSQRVMSTLAEFTEDLEMYSIDEAFLDVSGIAENKLEEFGRQIQDRVKKYTGVPVSVGIATTKTLAKVCNEFSKNEARKARQNGQESRYKGVFVIKQQEDEKRIKLLKELYAGDVWGIGRKSSQKLAEFPYRITTAWDFLQAPENVIKKLMGLNGLKIWRELQGVCCLNLEVERDRRQGILSSRSFGRSVTTKQELAEALTMHITHAAETLRNQHSAAAYLSVFIAASRHDAFNRYYGSLGASLPVQTQYTPDLVKVALDLLDKVFKPNFRYKKAGVYLSGLVDADFVQDGLFQTNPDPKKEKVMQVVDRLNQKYGRDSVRLASHKIKPTWQNKSELRSLRYTTVWQELLEVK